MNETRGYFENVNRNRVRSFRNKKKLLDITIDFETEI